MKLFFRIEESSNILGSKDKIVKYINLVEVKSVASDSEGGSIISHGSSETRVHDMSPDDLFSLCVKQIIES